MTENSLSAKTKILIFLPPVSVNIDDNFLRLHKTRASYHESCDNYHWRHMSLSNVWVINLFEIFSDSGFFLAVFWGFHVGLRIDKYPVNRNYLGKLQGIYNFSSIILYSTNKKIYVSDLMEETKTHLVKFKYYFSTLSWVLAKMNNKLGLSCAKLSPA